MVASELVVTKAVVPLDLVVLEDSDSEARHSSAVAFIGSEAGSI